MKTLVLLLAMVGMSASQTAAPIKGAWTATHDGHTFVRLELNSVNGAVTGGLSLGSSIEVDTQGVVKLATDAPRDLKPIFDVTRSGSVLTFSRKDGNDTDRFEVRLLDNGSVDLQFLLSEADRRSLARGGIPVPKPIRLTKQ